MARDDYDPDDVRTTRPTRRNPPGTDRLPPGEIGHSRASDPNWRGDRAARRRGSPSLPASRQEFALWLQYGGWRVIFIAAAVVVVAILVMLLWRNANKPLVRVTPTQTSSALNQQILPPLASVTPVISPTAPLAPQGVGGGASGGAQFRVTGTGTDGLFLRPDHSTDNQPIKTLQEGTIVTIIGEDFTAPDNLVWKHVRDLDGTEGWAAGKFLKPAP